MNKEMHVLTAARVLPTSVTQSHQFYFSNEANAEGDNPSIGIILSRNKDELLVEYATYHMNSQLFVQIYQLYLPDREALCDELELSLREAEQ